MVGKDEEEEILERKKGKLLEITSLFLSARISKASVNVTGKQWRVCLAEIMTQSTVEQMCSSHGFQNQWSTVQMHRGLFTCGSSIKKLIYEMILNVQ